jgi:DNA-binding NarL/FixJ family response regulator
VTPVPQTAQPAGIRLGQPDPAVRAVAGLVADGLTNPQIGERLYISRRTVQTHLVHVFAKLGIASRAQLAAQVTARSRPQPRGGPDR